MKLVFVETPLFTRILSDYLTDESYRELQRALMENPETGDLMPGTGGFRKVRWEDARRGKGKRGGLRTIYYYLTADHQIWFFTLYDKDEAADLAAEEKKVLKQKRKLFDELMEGVDAMRQQREGKITLRSHEVEDLPPLEVDADLIRDTRERMHVSRAVFARRLRVSTRTLENWEQGRARPNAQAAALILMVRKFPDTLKKLSELGNRAA